MCVPVDDGPEGCGQIGVRLVGVEFAGLDQRGDGCLVCGTYVMTGEEGIFAVQDDGEDGAIAPLPGR